MISDALAYPLKGNGKYILVIGAILSLLLSVGGYVPVLGLILAIGASGFFSAYMFKVINATTCGHDEACDWPDYQDIYSDLVVPWLCMLSATFFSFVPYAVMSFMSEEDGILSYILLILGFFHLPMAILCVAICGTMRSAFWATTVPLITRCLPQYFFLVLVFGGLSFINGLLNNVLSSIPFLGWFISFFLGMYSLMVTGRLLGLFNRENGHLIG
jgi:hypothetical protein